MTQTYNTIFESEADQLIGSWTDLDLQNVEDKADDQTQLMFCHAYLYMLKNDIAKFTGVIDRLEDMCVELGNFKDSSNVTMFDLCNIYNKKDFLDVLLNYEARQICKLIEKQEFAVSKRRSRM